MIHNLHILIDRDTHRRYEVPPVDDIQVRAALDAHMIAAHRRGEHPVGSMRRECPLCQLDK